MNHEECHHDFYSFRDIDFESAPETVYVEWQCDDCEAVLANVFEGTGRVLVTPRDPAADAYEVPVEAIEP